MNLYSIIKSRVPFLRSLDERPYKAPMWRHCHLTDCNRSEQIWQGGGMFGGAIMLETHNIHLILLTSIWQRFNFTHCNALRDHSQNDILLQIQQQQIANFGAHSSILIWGYCSWDSNWKHENDKQSDSLSQKNQTYLKMLKGKKLLQSQIPQVESPNMSIYIEWQMALPLGNF